MNCLAHILHSAVITGRLLFYNYNFNFVIQHTWNTNFLHSDPYILLVLCQIYTWRLVLDMINTFLKSNYIDVIAKPGTNSVKKIEHTKSKKIGTN